MSLVPEYKFPEVPYSMRTNTGTLRTGLCWQVRDGQGVWTPKYIIYESVITSIVFDIGTARTRAEATRRVLFKFPNDIEVCAAAWLDGFNQFYFTFLCQYNGVELSQAQYDACGMGNWYNKSVNINGANIQGSDGTDRLLNFVYSWICSYYPQSDPVENLTEPYDVMLDYFIPRAATSPQIPLPVSAIAGEFAVRDLYTYGQNQYPWPIMYDGATTASSTGTANFSIVNLTTFNTGMKTLGSGTDEDIFRVLPNPGPEDDPSGPGGGGGSYDPTSDPIDFPGLPTGGALTSGMIKGFVIGSSGLAQLQNKLWDMSFFDIATQFQKLVNQPLDCLISLHALPVLPTTDSTAEEIKLGSFPTGVSANKITNQYVVVDCGSLTVPEFYGNALDYGPYTKCEIYLPFIGLRSLVIDDVEKATIALKYYVDVLTGSVIAFIKCGQSVLYTYTGSCIQHIPATSQTSDLLHNTISAVGPIATGIVTGSPASAAAGAVAGAVNTASSKNHVSRSGDLAGAAGIMGEFCPYMVFHRPRQSLARDYNKFKGYPSNISYTLGTLTGYTEVEHVHLTGLDGASGAELNEIESLLKSGVII